MTLSEFKTYVRRDFKRTDKDTELVQAYNDMLKWLSVKMPIGDYKFQSYVETSAGIEDYEIPCDALHVLHPVTLLYGPESNGQNGFPLNNITKQQYDVRQPNPNTTNPLKGPPDAYTIFSRSILLTPVPDLDTYVLQINWAKLAAGQVLSGDVPLLGNEYDEVLKWGTLERLYAGMQRYDEAAYWAGKYHDQNDRPAGCLIDLFAIETSREGKGIGSIQNNWL